MKLTSAENASKIRSLARFNFIAGLPRSGVSVLTALLNQNPRFLARIGTGAQPVFAELVAASSGDGVLATRLDGDQKVALWRGAVDAVYHDRPFGSVVFDANRDWLDHVDILARLYPLCRFIVCLRNPASIVNSIVLSDDGDLSDAGLNTTIDGLMAEDGAVGRQLAALRRALSSRHAERIFVLDYDRLADDPEDVLDVLYDFLREDEFTHDLTDLTGDWPGLAPGPVRRSDKPNILTTRTVLQLSGRAFWRNLKRTSATMMLGRAR